MNDDEDLAKLLQAAGKRPQPDVELADKVRESTEQAWREAVKKRQAQQRRPWYVGFAAAAVLVLSLQGIYFSDGVGPASTLGIITYLDGQYSVNSAAALASHSFQSGDTLQTDANSILVFELNDKTSLTVSENTQLIFESESIVRVNKGRLYVDSPDSSTSITLLTQWGSMVDIGTQFEVQVDDALSVKVREGKVKLALDSGIYYASAVNGAGDVITVDREMAVTKATISSSDNDWRWTRAAMRPLDLDGVSVSHMLEWAGRVTGKDIVYASDQVQSMAKNTLMSGGQLDPSSIEGALPDLLKVTTLNGDVKEHRIEVR